MYVYVSVSCARILCVFVEDTNSVLNTTEYVRIRIRERILTTVYPYCIQEKLYPYGIYTDRRNDDTTHVSRRIL